VGLGARFTPHELDITMPFLADGHRRDLEASGLSPETIRRSGIYSAPEREVRALLGFGAGSGMVIPYWRADGTRREDFVRVKLDQPNARGRREYRQPLDSANHLYLPPLQEWARIFADPTIPLIVSEGEKKTLKANQEGLTTIGLGGVDSWLKGGRPIADLDGVTWTTRMVLIAFDADLVFKPSVARAEQALADELGRRGAHVFGVRLPPGEPWTKLDDYLCRRSVVDFLFLPRVLLAEPAADWEPPIPLEDRPVPAFPVDVFPPWAAAMVRALAQAIQVDVAMSGALTLAALAAVSMKRAEIMAPDGHREPLNLYVVPVSPSGERKTGVLGTIMAPIRQVEDEEAARALSIVQAAEAEAEWLQTLVKQLRTRLAGAKPSDRDSLRLELKDAEQKLTAHVVPVIPELTLDDVTAEALGRFMSEQHESAAVLSDEPTLFENLLSRYTKDNVPNLKLLLVGYDGGRTKVHRIGRAREFLKHPLITLGLTIQPGAAGEVVAHRIARDRGLPARCLFVVPTRQRGHRDGAMRRVPTAIDLMFRRQLSALARAQFREMAARDEQARAEHLDARDVPVPVLKTSHEAATVWSRFFLEVEHQMRDGERLEEIADWASKLQGAVSRIAGILHLADAPAEAPGTRPEIPVSVMERAVRLARCLLEHGLVAFGLLDADPKVVGARRILDWTRRTRRKRLTVREVQQWVGGAIKTREAADPSIKLLVDLGYLRSMGEPRPRGKLGRPAAEVFEVNPLRAVPHAPAPSTETTEPPSEHLTHRPHELFVERPLPCVRVEESTKPPSGSPVEGARGGFVEKPLPCVRVEESTKPRSGSPLESAQGGFVDSVEGSLPCARGEIDPDDPRQDLEPEP
jgi:Protein of unknown function (DUF3987)/Domain of unknown function (DUF3854)